MNAEVGSLSASERVAKAAEAIASGAQLTDAARVHLAEMLRCDSDVFSAYQAPDGSWPEEWMSSILVFADAMLDDEGEGNR